MFSRLREIPRMTDDCIEQATYVQAYKSPLKGKHRGTLSDTSRVKPPTEFKSFAYPPSTPGRSLQTPKTHHKPSRSFSQSTYQREAFSPLPQPLSILRGSPDQAVSMDSPVIRMECSLPPPPPLEIRSPKGVGNSSNETDRTMTKVPLKISTKQMDLAPPTKFSGLGVIEIKQKDMGIPEIKLSEKIPDEELGSNRSSISVSVAHIVAETEEERLYNETVEALKKAVGDYNYLASEVLSLENRINDGLKKTKALENELTTPKKMFNNSKYNKVRLIECNNE